MTLPAILSFLLARRRRLAFGFVGVSLVAGLAEALVIALVVKTVGQQMVQPGSAVPLGPVTLGVRVAIGMAAGMAVLRLLASAAAADLGARMAAYIRQDLRNRLVRAYAHADWSVQVRDRSGEFAEVATAKIDESGAIALAGTQAVVGGSTLVALLATSLVINPLATVVLIGTGAALFLLARPITARAYRGIAQSVVSRGNVASDIDSMCACTEEMHVYGAADEFCAKISESVATSERSFYKGQLNGRLAAAVFQSATLIILVVGTLALSLVPSGESVTALGAVIILLIRGAGLAQQVQMFSAVLGTQRPYVEAVAREIARYEDSWQEYRPTPRPRRDRRGGESALRDGEPAGALVLREASFSYPGSPAPALEPTTLTIPGRGAVGVQGPSGSGKSTLVQLLLGLRRPTTGSVSYAGVELSDVSPHDRSAFIALVSQVPKLVPGTIRENIAFFRDLTDEQVRTAALRAGVLDDVLALPDGFDTVVGQRVDPVSGGQRQRICIARALASTPDVLVLDEPTSSLDAESEAVVVRTLAELARTMCVIIVSHRSAPLAICTTVLELTGGRVEVTRTAPASSPEAAAPDAEPLAAAEAPA